jgi:hypothetical protein
MKSKTNIQVLTAPNERSMLAPLQDFFATSAFFIGECD